MEFSTLKIRHAALALVLGLGLAGSLQVFHAAAAGGGDDGETTPTCKKGEVYDKKAQKCVKQSSAVITDENRADYAYALAKEGRYDEALAMLDTVKDQNDPEVLNYRGYATRKLGRTDEGISYYLRSVAAAPRYAKVREYLGEAYIIKGRLDLAQEQLTEIRSICGTSCEEYVDLDQAIRNPTKS
ncbi:tetratricopeptide repeat protein [Oryzifoliimicrobium ureilyticus]|uniref:tetratricopeptide repeat protein n=1 Tax=Oryzifoliimicrobium ureilyticus TaxID=3113724 RepID=UPI00307634B0